MPTPTNTAARSSNLVAIAIIGALFFIMGWFTWLNGPLISFVQLAFELNVVNAFLVTFVSYLSYFFWALPASWILDRTGMKRGMALALWVMATGAFAFGEFCTRRWYPGALGGLFVIFAGLAVLQTAANPYISILGPIESAAQRISIMGICNKTAGLLAPILLGTFVLHGMDNIADKVKVADAEGKAQLLADFARTIHAPYLLMAAVLMVLGVAILFSPLPDVRKEHEERGTKADAKTILEFPHLWLGVVAIFVYVGAEVMAGDAIGTYGRSFNIPLDVAKYFTSGTLACMLIGYLVGGALVPRFYSQQQYLAFSALLGIALTVSAFFSSGYVSVAFVIALGFANAMMWPAIFPLAIHGLGRLIERGAALLIMGIAGGAIIPQAFAYLKQSYDFQAVFLALMVPCYLYIWYYATRGHRAGQGATLAAAQPSR